MIIKSCYISLQQNFYLSKVYPRACCWIVPLTMTTTYLGMRHWWKIWMKRKNWGKLKGNHAIIQSKKDTWSKKWRLSQTFKQKSERLVRRWRDFKVKKFYLNQNLSVIQLDTIYYWYYWLGHMARDYFIKFWLDRSVIEVQKASKKSVTERMGKSWQKL